MDPMSGLEITSILHAKLLSGSFPEEYWFAGALALPYRNLSFLFQSLPADQYIPLALKSEQTFFASCSRRG
jgi:hypothetical protein